MPISITKITHFSGHKEAIYTLFYSKERKKVYSGGMDGMLVSWEMTGNGDGELIAKTESTIYTSCFHPDEKYVFLGLRNGELLCINIDTQEIIKRLILTTSPIFSSIIVKDKLYIGTENGTLYTLTLELELLHHQQLSGKTLRTIVSKDDNIYIGTSQNQIITLNTTNNTYSTQEDAHENSIFCLAMANGKLWSGSRDAHIKIWENETEVLRTPAHNLHVNSLDYNAENKFMLSGSMDKSVKIWNGQDGKLLKVLNKEKCDYHISSVNKVLWIGPNEFISCGDDRKLIYTEIDY